MIILGNLQGQGTMDSLDKAFFNKCYALYKQAQITSDWDQAILYADSMRLISQKKKYHKGISNGLILKGEAYMRKGELSMAYHTYIKTLGFVNSNEYNGNWRGRLNKDLFILFSKQKNQDSTQKYKDIIFNLPCKKSTILAKDYVAKQLLGSNDKETLLWINNNNICAEELDAKSMLLNNLRLLGYFYQDVEDYDKAIFYIDSTLKVAQELNDTLFIGGAYHDLGLINSTLKNYSKALEWNRKGVQIIEKIDNESGFYVNSNLLRLRIPMGIFYQSLANAYYNIDQENNTTIYSDSIRFFYQKSLQDSYKKKDTAQIVLSLTNVAVYITSEGKNYNEALDSLEKAYNIAHRYIDWEVTQYYIYNNKGVIYTKTKQYNKAQLYLDKAESIAPTIADSTSLLIETYKLQKELYLAKGDYKKAYDYEIKMTFLYKQQQEAIRQKTLIDFETKYETEQVKQQNIVLAQERDIQQLKAERNQQLIYVAVIFLVFILIIFILLISQFRTKAFLSNQKLKYRLLRNQMNPHFIFNSLEAIQSFVYKKKPLEAGEYIASFAELMRAVLDNSHEEYISLNKEIQWLENYLKLQLLRFGNRFDYTLNIDPKIDIDDTMIPPMLTQPFIENALEHGLRDIDYKGHLDININLHNNILQIDILDNGIGLLESMKKNKEREYKSRATKITQERLTFLNKKQTKSINLSIEPNNENGTKISFGIPFISQH